jgi:hypothetical protein
MDQMGLFDRPTSPPRRTDPPTSGIAANAPFRRGSQRHRLLQQYAVVDAGLIDETAALRAGIDRGCPWKRCSELREDLHIAAVPGEVENSSMGVPQQVCRITGKGRAVLADIERETGYGV